MICLKNKKTIVIITNHNFHLHNQLVDASQMLGKFEIFYYNKNVHNVSWYEKPKFSPVPCLTWCIDIRIPGRKFLSVFKKIKGGRRKLLFLYPVSWKMSGPMSSNNEVIKFLKYSMT